MAYGGKVPVIRKTDDEMGKQTNKQKHPMLGPGDKKKKSIKGRTLRIYHHQDVFIPPCVCLDVSQPNCANYILVS